MKTLSLQKTLALLATLLFAPLWAQPSTPFAPVEAFQVPARAEGQTHVLELRTEPLETVRIAIIGLGNRGQGAVHRLSFIDQAEITVLVDVVPGKVEKAQAILKAKGRPAAVGLTGAEDWKEVVLRDDVDLVYICTHWALHTPIAVAAMENGKHAAIEVPAALTVEEAWQLVDTAERTRRHCMMLENTNYDFFELATLRMAHEGALGEVVHAEGAYIHDLRELMFSDTYYWKHWRLKRHQNEKGNLYPTHGLGPIAHAMNIHRGDRMAVLTSLETAQFGLTAYAKETYGEDSPEAQQEYRKGDMSTTLIKTAKGKTIMIQHDVVSPRPYSRIHLLSGTKGIVRKWPETGIAFGHSWLEEEEMEKVLEQYEHPIVSEIGEKAKEVGGHGGMDFMMDYRLIYCLRHGLPLDQDVYDAAEWSVVTELSRYSTENNGVPVAFPDFTRGAWEELDRVRYYHVEDFE